MIIGQLAFVAHASLLDQRLCGCLALPPHLQEELDKMKSSLGNAILEEKPNVK